MVAAWVQLLGKGWHFYWGLQQKNFFIVHSVLLLIQVPCRDSLDLGQLSRNDILPFKRSVKTPPDASQGTLLMLTAVVRLWMGMCLIIVCYLKTAL